MNIFKKFSEKDKELLKNINIKIIDKEYAEAELKELVQNIYVKGYLNTEITYADAEKYRQIYERFECLGKIDFEKVQKYGRKEFEDDYYLCTVMMHGTVWNSPNRINKIRESRNEPPLAEDERLRYQAKAKENSKKLLEYTKYLEEKYGGELSMVEKYYNTMEEYD